MSNEIFYKKARKCKACGRILFSSKSIEAGYGCYCEKKIQKKKEEQKPIDGQINIFDWLGYGQKIEGQKAQAECD